MHVFLAGADPDRRPVHFVQIAGACTDAFAIYRDVELVLFES